MALQAGLRLGPYEIVAPLGTGGMGEVYKALDTRLQRSVAIKVLPGHLASDAQLRDRFEREARVISSLNHPHICVLYDVGRQDEVDFLVLELLDGRTLADRLVGGAVPSQEALRIGAQIGAALDRAHRSGITHRDLKPANVMLTAAGAKLLDFGLAKPSAAAVAGGLSTLPTTPPNMTAQGAIVGTLQYMAPEQVEGLEADVRTDVFAFGALLFEMIVGRAPFQGKTRAGLLGAILKDDPPPVSSLQPSAPRALDRLVARCLAKDPDERWQSVADIVHELRWIEGAGAQPVAESPANASRSLRMAWTIAALATAVAVGFGVVSMRDRSPVQPRERMEFTLGAPEHATFSTPAGGGTGVAPQVSVAPDGRTIAFVAESPAGHQVWVRSIASVDARPLAGTEGSTFPFWSPDSRYIGFFANGRLKKILATGGPAVTLCDAAAGRGGTWNRDNVILFGRSTAGPLMRVSASGGTPVPASSLDAAYAETSHRFPQFLPDGRRFLFAATVGTCCPAAKPGRIKLGTLDTMDASEIMRLDASTAVYASGHVLFSRNGTLMAQPFDVTAGRLSGDDFPVIEHVASEGSRYVAVSGSDTGVLAYARGRGQFTSRLVWVGRDGKEIAAVGRPGSYSSAALSPDERRIAVALNSGSPPNRDIWIVDAARGLDTRVTFGPEDRSAPFWSPDGKRIVFQAIQQGALMLRVKDLSGSGTESTLAQPTDSTTLIGAIIPTSWSRDGRFVVFTRSPGTAGSSDLWVHPMSGAEKPFPVVQTGAPELHGELSPDARWIAYTSTETGTAQIFVQSFPEPGMRYQVSRDGGTLPQWRADGKEIYFLSPDLKLMVAAVDQTKMFEVGAPTMLFETTASAPGPGQQYSASRDGRRFLINAVVRDDAKSPLTIVTNWLGAVQR